MARWLVLAVAGALCVGAGAARYADYSAARMPQYEAVNYDAPAASSPAEDYRDRSADNSAPIDYNHYEQDSIDRKDDEMTFSNLKSQPTTVVLDDGDLEYNYKPDENLPKVKYNFKRPLTRNINKKKTNTLFPRSLRSGFNVNNYQPLDDEDSLEHLEEEKDFDPDTDKNKFVRRDIRQKIRRKPWNQVTTHKFRELDYDDPRNGKQMPNVIKGGGPAYPELEPQQNVQNEEQSAVRSNRVSRPPAFTSLRTDVSASRQGFQHMAPMPSPRSKGNNYVDSVDYNDINKIDKIKSNIPPRPAKPRGQPLWTFQEDFRRRNFAMPPQETETGQTHTVTSATTQDITQITTRGALSQRATTGVLNVSTPIQPLPQSVIDNITSFVNMSKQLSIAEKSQLSIQKKSRRKDSVKEEILRNKPPVLLQVTERLQTVVMVEPPVTQEPWLRARDIAEDSPDRIAKVKRFMRNKLVANARNISELMENWDDTVCDYVDISLLDDSVNSAVSVYSCSPVSICLLLGYWLLYKLPDFLLSLHVHCCLIIC